MTDTQQAAERLSDVYKTGDGCRVYGCPPDEAVERMRDDEVALLRAWLDPTPIDADWLRSVGFEVDGRDLCLFVKHDELTASQLVVRDGKWRFGGGSPNHQSLAPLRVPPKTRGDLRRLASVLGLSLKETSE